MKHWVRSLTLAYCSRDKRMIFILIFLSYANFMFVVDLLRVNDVMHWVVVANTKVKSWRASWRLCNIPDILPFIIITHTQQTQRTHTTYYISRKGCREKIYVMKNRDGVGAQKMKMLKLSKENGIIQKEMNGVKKKVIERMGGKKRWTKENRQYGTISEQ